MLVKFAGKVDNMKYFYLVIALIETFCAIYFYTAPDADSLFALVGFSILAVFGWALFALEYSREAA